MALDSNTDWSRKHSGVVLYVYTSMFQAFLAFGDTSRLISIESVRYAFMTDKNQSQCNFSSK